MTVTKLKSGERRLLWWPSGVYDSTIKWMVEVCDIVEKEIEDKNPRLHLYSEQMLFPDAVVFSLIKIFCCCLATKWCLTLWPQGLQSTRFLWPRDFPARILQWVDISFSRGSSRPRDRTSVSYTCLLHSRWILYCQTTNKNTVVVKSLSHDWLFVTPWTAARPPCPSPSPEVCPSSCPLHRWCHPAISSSDAFFCFCPPSFPASGINKNISSLQMYCSSTTSSHYFLTRNWGREAVQPLGLGEASVGKGRWPPRHLSPGSYPFVAFPS